MERPGAIASDRRQIELRGQSRRKILLIIRHRDTDISVIKEPTGAPSPANPPIIGPALA